MDTGINVVPNAEISKTQNHIFFIYIKNINFFRIYLGVARNHPVQKIGVLWVKWQGKMEK